jgi:hypothetical protein
MLDVARVSTRYVGSRKERSGVAPLIRATLRLRSRGLTHSFAGQKTRLLHPSGELSFVELVVFMDVEGEGAQLRGCPMHPNPGVNRPWNV